MRNTNKIKRNVPPNILSYTSPVTGHVIKEWLRYHIENNTEYTRIAVRMERFLNISDEKMYKVCLSPSRTGCNEKRKGYPTIISVEF